MRKPKESKRKYDLSNSKDLKQIEMIAWRWMSILKMPQFSDDFFKELCIIFLSEKRNGATFAQLAIDFARKKTGDLRDCKASFLEAKRNINMGIYSTEVDTELQSNDKDIAEFISDSLIVQGCLDKLKSNERLLLVLYFVYGFKMKELGYIMGVTENSVCIRINYALNKVRSN